MSHRQVLFITGTRADYGKLKSVIRAVDEADDFDYTIFATGMHLLDKYGTTWKEIEKDGFANIFLFFNQDHFTDSMMDRVLADTIKGISHFVAEHHVDLIVVHGDRIEALAGAIVGSLNGILVGHIEGGELSGTVDELHAPHDHQDVAPALRVERGGVRSGRRHGRVRRQGARHRFPEHRHHVVAGPPVDRRRPPPLRAPDRRVRHRRPAPGGRCDRRAPRPDRGDAGRDGGVGPSVRGPLPEQRPGQRGDPAGDPRGRPTSPPSACCHP